MRFTLLLAACCVGLLCGCEGDYQGKPNQPTVDIKETPPDMNPRTDHDIEVNTPDVDVDVKRNPGGVPDVNVDVLKTPDEDTKANQP